jgi:hypothetical protein
MSDKIKLPFSRREWWLVLLLTSVVQGGIWYAAFVNSGEGSALNYISFAGTLVSIILAVLAIGYTYAETQSQKNRSDSVASQIGILNEVIKNIQIESAALESISVISEDLKSISLQIKSNQSQTDSKLADVESTMKHLADTTVFKEMPDSQDSTRTPIDKEKNAKALMQSESPLVILPILGMFLANNKAYKTFFEIFEDNLFDYIYDTILVLNIKDDKTNIRFALFGSFYSLIYTLSEMQLISLKPKNKLNVSPELVKAVNTYTNSTLLEWKTPYTEIRKAFIEAIQSKTKNNEK